jgi:hypothetical protein
MLRASSLVVKAPTYRPEGCGFDSSGGIHNLSNNYVVSMQQDHARGFYKVDNDTVSEEAKRIRMRGS